MDTPERVANRFLTSPLARLPNRMLASLPVPELDPDESLLEDSADPQPPSKPLSKMEQEVELAWEQWQKNQVNLRPQPLPEGSGDLEF